MSLSQLTEKHTTLGPNWSFFPASGCLQSAVSNRRRGRFRTGPRWSPRNDFSATLEASAAVGFEEFMSSVDAIAPGRNNDRAMCRPGAVGAGRDWWMRKIGGAMRGWTFLFVRRKPDILFCLITDWMSHDVTPLLGLLGAQCGYLRSTKKSLQLVATIAAALAKDHPG